MPPNSCSRIPSDARAISSALAVFTSAASTSWQAEHTEKCASQCAVSSFPSMCMKKAERISGSGQVCAGDPLRRATRPQSSRSFRCLRSRSSMALYQRSRHLPYLGTTCRRFLAVSRFMTHHGAAVPELLAPGASLRPAEAARVSRALRSGQMATLPERKQNTGGPAHRSDDSRFATFLRRGGAAPCGCCPSGAKPWLHARPVRSEEHTSELQSRLHLVCRLLLEKKKKKRKAQPL